MYRDRNEAGERLAELILDNQIIANTEQSKCLVLSIPRGGVIVGDILARALGCRHDVIIIKKVGHPQCAELAVGAVVEDGLANINHRILALHPVPQYELARKVQRAKATVERYIELFRDGHPLDLRYQTIFVVDDGIATGETLSAAVRWIHTKRPATGVGKTIIAVPVASERAAKRLMWLVDSFICPYIPSNFDAVGQFYEQFDQVTDEAVLTILQAHEELSP
jgi:putative phosphoribosyl transferase